MVRHSSSRRVEIQHASSETPLVGMHPTRLRSNCIHAAVNRFRKPPEPILLTSTSFAHGMCPVFPLGPRWSFRRSWTQNPKKKDAQEAITRGRKANPACYSLYGSLFETFGDRRKGAKKVSIKPKRASTLSPSQDGPAWERRAEALWRLGQWPSADQQGRGVKSAWFLGCFGLWVWWSIRGLQLWFCSGVR